MVQQHEQHRQRRITWKRVAYAFAIVYGGVMAYFLVPEVIAEGARSRTVAAEMRREIHETWTAHRDSQCQLVKAEERPFTNTKLAGKALTTTWRPVRVWRCGDELFDEIAGRVPQEWVRRIRSQQ